MSMHPVIMISGLIVPTTYYEKWTCIPEWFRQNGVDFHVHQRPSDLSIEGRFKVLEKFLGDVWFKDRPYHLLCHSAGGIDGRYYLHKTQDKRCQSIITIGTPHAGTPVANAALDPQCKIKKKVLGYLFEKYENAKQAVYEMTPEHMAQFNSTVKNVDDIHYGSILFEIDWWKAGPLSWENYFYLKKLGHEANDGTVPTFSQVWGETGNTILKGDHKAQLAPFDYGGREIWRTTCKEYLKRVLQIERS
jgi:pimeloyl-ACP methyl ester carboxylesterase